MENPGKSTNEKVIKWFDEQDKGQGVDVICDDFQTKFCRFSCTKKSLYNKLMKGVAKMKTLKKKTPKKFYQYLWTIILWCQ